MSKKARERKRLIRILKSQGVPSDPKSVKDWQRKIRSLYWQNELERTIISRYRRQKRCRLSMCGYANYGMARYSSPGEWEPNRSNLFHGVISYKGDMYHG